MGEDMIIVTGGLGFIGSNFVRYMDDPSVVVVDALRYGSNIENLKGLDYKLVRGDICDYDLMAEVIKGGDVIVNFAAESVPGEEFLVIQENGRIMLKTFEEFFRGLRGDVIFDGRHEIVDVSGDGINVLSFYNGFGVFRPLRRVIRHRFKGKLLRLRQGWGEIIVTPNHSVYDVRGDVVEAFRNPELLCIRRINHHGHGLGSYTMGGGKQAGAVKLDSLVRLLAAYISEDDRGFVGGARYPIIISDEDKGWLKILSGDFQGVFGGSSRIRKVGGGYQLEFRDRGFYEICGRLCGRSENKKVPDFIYNLDRDHQLLFWETLLRGDSGYTTMSRRLAAGLSLLLGLLGVGFTLHIMGEGDARYTIKTGPPGEIKVCNELVQVDYEGYVYDLEVEGSHNFVTGVGNIVAHNTHVDRSIAKPHVFIQSNVIGLFTILEAMRRVNPDARLVQISTDEVYGEIEKGSFREGDPLRPSSPYSASKAAGDMLLLSYVKTYGLDAMITRCTNNYGPYQFPEKLIPKTIIRASMDMKIPIYGTGENIRDWIYVRDHCEAIDLVMERGEMGEIYNISSGDEKNNLELVKKILEVMGKDEDLIEFVEDRPGHDLRYSLDSTKIKEMGWKPRHNLKEGLEETIRWYLKNRWWWEPLVDEKVLHPTPWKLRW